LRLFANKISFSNIIAIPIIKCKGAQTFSTSETAEMCENGDNLVEER